MLSKQNSSGKNNSEFTIQGCMGSEKSNLTVLDVPGLLELCYVHGKILTDLSCH